MANERSSLPIAYQLSLPREWAEDAARRRKAAVPPQVGFATKVAIALEQLRAAREARVPVGVVLADAGYGNDTGFRRGIDVLGLTCAVGIQGSITVWSEGHEPLPPRGDWGRGQLGTRQRRNRTHQPIDARALAHELPGRAWRRIEWRDGTNGLLASRFARVRVRAAHRRNEVHPQQWLVIKWPLAETEPTKYWLATLPESIAVKEQIRLIKLRWRVERDYQKLKQELGLGHHDGRNWRGVHRHATLSIAACGSLMKARLTGRAKTNPAIRPDEPLLPLPPRPTNFIPRGSSPCGPATHR